MWLILLTVVIVTLFVVSFKPKELALDRSRKVGLLIFWVLLLGWLVWIFFPKY